MISKLDVMKAASSLQACGGQETGAEAAIHGVHNIIKDQNREVVLSIDAINALNTINSTPMLHNISDICPIISIHTNKYP